MFALRRKAVQSAGGAPRAAGRGTRRYASTEHAKAAEGAHHAEHGHHHAGAQPESLGTAFYITLAAIPISIGVYAASRTSADGTVPGLSKIIDSYSYYKDRWVARNTLHTAMIEQAAFDRNLYQSSTGSTHVNLRFPEIFNTGSPFNVPAGHGPRNMDQLVAHYEKLNREGEEKTAKALAEKESEKDQ